MRTCTSGAPASKSMRDDLPRRVAADDRVVDDDDALAGDLGERVELQPDALLAQPLVGLDERAADVAVLDQALAERDPARAREADRGRRAGVGDRHHEVGLDRRLLGEPLAHPHARRVHLDARRASSRAGRGRRTRRCRARRASGCGTACVECDALLVDERRARRGAPRARSRRRPGRARTSRTRRTQSSSSRPRRAAGMPCGSRKRDQLALGERDDRVRALEPSPSRARRPPRAAPGRSRSARRSPRCRRSSRARCRRPRARRAARRRSSGCRCARARPCARGRGGRAAARSPSASSRSSSSACARSRRSPLEPAQLLLVEDLRDEAHVAEHGQPAAVGDGDAGRLLAAVLEREEAEVREARDVALGRADAEDAAHLEESPPRPAAARRAGSPRSVVAADGRRCAGSSSRAERARSRSAAALAEAASRASSGRSTLGADAAPERGLGERDREAAARRRRGRASSGAPRECDDASRRGRAGRRPPARRTRLVLGAVERGRRAGE